MNHEAGNRACKEYKYEEELLAIQYRSRVSRAQASLIFNRENPQFRTMNYAKAASSITKATPGPSSTVRVQNKTQTSELQPPTSTTPITPEKTNLNRIPKPTSTENLYADLPSPHHEDTSETHALVRDQALKIFNEHQFDENAKPEDRNEHEKRPRSTSTTKRKNSPSNSGNPTKRRPTESNKKIPSQSRDYNQKERERGRSREKRKSRSPRSRSRSIHPSNHHRK